jgi:hypothetical protein
MGINNLQLSPDLIATLYPETLVAGTDPDSPGKPGKTRVPDASPEPAYTFLGNNLRSVCFVVEDPGHEFLADEKLQFLNRVLNACKCSMDDIALVNAAHLPVKFNDLKKQLQPQILFLWGTRPVSIGLDRKLPDFSISPVAGVSVIPVPQPDVMSGDSPSGLELKHRLWACLKKLFNL